MSDDRPPAYPSKSSLARELDCAESTIDELVRKGILPPPLRLPGDPHSPEFWTALRQAQGIVGPVATDSIEALIDAYIAAWPRLPEKLSSGTQNLYRRNLNRARKLWGKLPATGLRPAHVQAVM